jgi:MFS family permease
MELTISTPRLAAARILPRTPRAFYRTAINAFFFVKATKTSTESTDPDSPLRIPDIKAALQMSDAALGSVLLAAPLGEMLSIAPTAWLIGRFRSRRVIMLGLMLMPCALLSLALAGSPHWLAAALLGFANNMLNISLNAQAVGVETLYGRSIMATFHGMWSLGGVAGCIIGSIVAPLGVAPLPHFAAIFVITLATLCCLRTWTMPREVRIGAAAPESGKRSFRPDLYLTLLGCIALGSMATEGAMYDWSSVYFAQVVQPGESLIRAGYLACMCAMVTGRLLADGLVNRFGVTPVLQLSGLCIAAGLSLALLWPDLLPATAGLALVGFGMASVVPLCYSLAGKSTRVPPSVAISLVSSLSFLGFLGCPPMVGFLSHQFDLRWALSPIVVVGVAIFCLAPLVRRIKA